jgi:hypothetical protein
MKRENVENIIEGKEYQSERKIGEKSKKRKSKKKKKGKEKRKNKS